MKSDIAAGGSPDLNSAFGQASNNNDPYFDVLVSLKQVKDENVFFVLFQIFQIYLGFDAIVRQSVIQLIAHTFIEFLGVIFALIQLGETLRWHGKVGDIDSAVHQITDTGALVRALHYEIGVSVILFTLACIFAYLCRLLLLQFGWNTYKRLGADIQLQSRFRMAQIFLLNLKMDAFFHLVFSIFWIVVMTQEGYFKRDAPSLAWYILHLILTVVQVPFLFVARHAIRQERAGLMYSFLFVHFCMIVDFIIVLEQSAGNWVFWVLAVCWAILLSLVTMVLGWKVTTNFDTGLKPHIQRLFDENYREKLVPGGVAQKHDSWVIDED
ncbi:hypothetical protein BC940DRAFT_306300 [Gongronella butleri]|nr:hypothetical protein BC940DRAFT_306300 [Gongronella butleri]